MELFWLAFLWNLITFSDGRKNVLFLVADDMRPELSSYYGGSFPSKVHPPIHSPNLEALAGKSLLFKRAYVQQAVCGPSRASLLTGRRPDTTHVYDLNSYFRNVGGNFTTIPQYFKMNGYNSVGMGKIFHPGAASGDDDDAISWSMPYYHSTGHHYGGHGSSWRAVPETEWKQRPLPDTQIADNAIAVLRKLAPTAITGSKPFFIAVGFHKPHLPFVYPDSMHSYYAENSIRLPDNPFVPTNLPRVAWNGYQELIAYNDINSSGVNGAFNTTLADQKAKELRRAYYSCISYIDNEVGRVLQELKTLGLENNTIVSFFGDHGWHLGEHAEWGKSTNFELATHAPLMIHIPSMTDNGIVTDNLVEFVDIFPTLVEAAGFPSLATCPDDSSQINTCHEGVSLLPLVKNPSTTTWKKAAFSQYPRHRRQHSIMGYTMRTEQYRYTEWVGFNGSPTYAPDWNSHFGAELYDHQTDPEENHNLAYDHHYTTTRNQLRQQLHAGWRPQIPQQPSVVG